MTMQLYLDDAKYYGHEEGLEEGREERQREVVLNMYRKNCTAEQISDLTGIDIKDVKRIISSQENYL